MRKILHLLLFLLANQTLYLHGNCKASFDVDALSCSKWFFTNTSYPSSDTSYVSHWKINGSIYYGERIEIDMDAADTFKVWLFIADTVNHCSDSIYGVYPGKKKIIYDYYVYKQNLIVTLLTPRTKSVYYQIFWDDNYINQSPSGLFKHFYVKTGKYRVSIEVWDSIIAGKWKLYCPSFRSDSIVINNNNQCRSYFVQFQSLSPDTVLLANRAVGEHMVYKWDFGDGSSSTKGFPTHTYTNTGKKQVCLTIKDTVSNCTDMYCDSIYTVAGRHMQVIGDFIPQDTTPTQPAWTSHPSLKNATLYPNPSKNVVTVQWPAIGHPLEWSIQSTGGSILRSGTCQSNSNSLSLDLTTVSSGIYFISLRTGREQQVFKMVKID